MLIIKRSNQFKRDYRRMMKRGKNATKLIAILEKLSHGKALPIRCRDHVLSGDYQDMRECHIEPDWLLVYSVWKEVIRLDRTGTHSDLFKK